MNIFVVTFSLLWETLYPPKLRKAVALAWGIVVMRPLQWLSDAIFISYADGSTDPDYNNATAYSKDDRVIFTDRGQYEAKQATTGNLPTDLTFWRKVNDNYIGARERAKYTSQKILFEYALDRIFQTTGIFITNFNTPANSFLMGETGPNSSAMFNDGINSTEYLTENFIVGDQDFTINVPLATFNALASNDLDRENVVRGVADIYVIGGMIYKVATF